MGLSEGGSCREKSIRMTIGTTTFRQKIAVEEVMA